MKKFQYVALAVGLMFLSGTREASAAPIVEQNTRQSVGTSPIPGEGTASDLFFLAGPGLAIQNGITGWAVNLGLLKEYSENSNLFIGADLGLNLWNYNTAGVVGSRIPTGTTGIQFLPTAIYRFQVAGSVFPYMGVSAGPFLRFNNYVLNGDKSSDTDLQFEILFRPGFFLSMGQSVSLQVEGKLGAIDGDFIFLPQANAVFSL